MPKATVRANARTTPRPKPGSAESINRQVDELRAATALFEAAKVVEKLAEPNASGEATDAPESSVEEPKDLPAHLVKRFAFDRAYCRWLSARAAREHPDGPEDEESTHQRYEEYAQAEREFMLMPAILDWMVWRKLEAFTLCLEDDLRTGERADHFSLLALAAIKADLLRLGIGDDEGVMAAIATEDERRAV